MMKNNIKNQMRPFSDTSIYDEKKTPPVAQEATQDDTQNEPNPDTQEETDQETTDCNLVLDMTESSQQTIYTALKAKFESNNA